MYFHKYDWIFCCFQNSLEEKSDFNTSLAAVAILEALLIWHILRFYLRFQPIVFNL